MADKTDRIEIKSSTSPVEGINAPLPRDRPLDGGIDLRPVLYSLDLFAPLPGLPGPSPPDSIPSMQRLPIKFDQQKHLPPIGTAEMLTDETIVLHLEAETLDGKTHGDGLLTIKPGDQNYNAIKAHIGDLTIGEIKFVAPWLDSLPGSQSPHQELGQNGLKKGDVAPFGDTAPGALSPGSQAAGTQTVDTVLPPSQVFEDQVNKTYAAMSPQVKAIIAKSGAKVVGVHHLTDAMPELKGVAPRGWPAGATWDSVDGCWSAGKNEIIVAEERKLMTSNQWVPSGRTDQVERHETGHAVDFTIKTMSEHDDFKKAYDADVQAMPAKDKNQLSYFLQPGVAGREETAAESVADREGGATGGVTFHQDFSNTLKVVNDTINGISPSTPLQPGAPGAASGPSEPLSPMRPMRPH